jgi:hypothetical protein
MYYYIVNRKAKSAAIGACKSSSNLSCILKLYYTPSISSDTSSSTYITNISFSGEGVYCFTLNAYTCGKNDSITVNFIPMDDGFYDIYNFGAVVCAGYPEGANPCPNSTGQITANPCPITTQLISGNVIFYAINLGTYGVSIPGITTETKNFVFDPIDTNNWTQIITPQT